MTPVAVFDAGVLLQAAGSPAGPSGRCLELAWNGLITLQISAVGLEEISDVLFRPKVRKKFRLLDDERVQTFLHELQAAAQMVRDVPELVRYPRDPDDEYILNLALATKASHIVSRDNDLLDLANVNNHFGIEIRKLAPALSIVKPEEFLALMAP